MIVLIDSGFPYAGGEPFLRIETPFLSTRQEKLLIYPIKKKGSARTSALPDNAEVRDLTTHFSAAARLRSFLQTLADPMFWSDIADVCRRHFSFKRIAAAFFYAEQVNLCLRLIERDIQAQLPEGERVVLYSYWMHTHACIAAKLKKRINNSVFITRCHGYDVYEDRSSVGFLPGRKLIFSAADKILPVSERGKDYLEATYPYLDRELVEVSYLGTCDSGRNPADDRCLRLVSCSNAVAVKRIDLLIRALSLLTDLSLEWVHYGAGALLDDLKKQAAEIIPSNIRVRFEGFVDNQRLMERYAQEPVSFFVNVSESEGLPVSVMEAMSFGIPAVATDVGGTGEIVKDGCNGFLVRKDVTPQQLAAVLRTALTTDAAQQDRLRKNARQTWENKFDAEKNYAAFSRYIAQL